ncbi:MAG: hypothetical protein JWM57_2592, partial [Phycisphaerales bacterium]|nr:hypothetical protein [Phycisphaerales bacterium]
VGIDPVIGQEAAVPTPPNPPSIPQSWPTEWGDEDFAAHPKAKFSFGGFVTMKGGEYFFAPSLPFLKNIVNPPKPPTPPAEPAPPEGTKPYNAT